MEEKTKILVQSSFEKVVPISDKAAEFFIQNFLKKIHL